MTEYLLEDIGIILIMDNRLILEFILWNLNYIHQITDRIIDYNHINNIVKYFLHNVKITFINNDF